MTVVLLSIGVAALCGGLVFLGFLMGCMLTHRDYEGARSGLDCPVRRPGARPGGRGDTDLFDARQYLSADAVIDADELERQRAAAGRRA